MITLELVNHDLEKQPNGEKRHAKMLWHLNHSIKLLPVVKNSDYAPSFTVSYLGKKGQ